MPGAFPVFRSVQASLTHGCGQNGSGCRPYRRGPRARHIADGTSWWVCAVVLELLINDFASANRSAPLAPVAHEYVKPLIVPTAS